MARRFALAPGILLALALLLWPRAVAGSPTRAPLDSTPVGTSFTYQGELKQSGAPVNGTCDIQFSLFDALTGGTQIGSTQTIGGVSVANGLFTVGLEFGPGAFNGDARWLQIAPACPPGSGFTTLTPRQALTPSPYAIFAPNIPLAGSGTATTAARSDHDHFGQSWIGASSSPGLVLQNTSTVAGIRGLSVRQGGP